MSPCWGGGTCWPTCRRRAAAFDATIDASARTSWRIPGEME
ncbi:hypothetical protein BSIN_3650 [Burkholderia singularis]|uniref:Uncharacterized protein n=1 Tax=Burkholderia singularis TaxID=1503053 RepID=A0A238H5M1_9BURK|nr:hypothetical protein BSIN_3650 [Burkholderia singularis]